MVITEAICLKTWAFGEADRIVAFHSPDKGNIRAIAKGVKRAKSKLAAACQPLNCCEIQLLPGQSAEKSLAKLIQVQPIESFPRLRENLSAMALGLICAELSLNLSSEDTEHDAPILYAMLLESLGALNANERGPDSEPALVAITVQFIMQWLNLAGYPPHWDACMVCEALFNPLKNNPARPYQYFSADLGGLVCTGCRQKEANRMLMLSANPVAVSNSTLAALQAPHSPSCWEGANIKKILSFCDYYLSHKLGHSIKAFGFALSLLTPLP